MNRVPAACEIRKFRPACQNAVRAQVNVVASVFIIENFSIAGHQNGHGIRKQKHARGNGTGEPVYPFISNSDVFQFHGVHQVMQGHVGIAPA
jgi:hypothetical protein